jgi:hypothetical protein
MLIKRRLFFPVEKILAEKADKNSFDKIRLRTAYKLDYSYLKEFSGLDVLPLVVWQFLATYFQPKRNREETDFSTSSPCFHRG